MLRSVEAQVNTDGSVETLEPIEVSVKTRAIVTVLDEVVVPAPKGNGKGLLDLLSTPEFAARKSYTTEEIERHVDEARNSWD